TPSTLGEALERWDVSANRRLTDRYSVAADLKSFKSELARPERFELPTPGFVGRCSIQLSYGRVWQMGPPLAGPCVTTSVIPTRPAHTRREVPPCEHGR